MAKKSSFKIPGLSFSWKRALGITSAKRKIAKATGIPTTKAGRQRKARRSGVLCALQWIYFILYFSRKFQLALPMMPSTPRP